MTLMPKKSKFRKSRKGHLTGLSKAGTFVDFGEFGIQALERGYVTAQQIEACRVAVSVGARWIVVPTRSGATAARVSACSTQNVGGGTCIFS